MHKENGETSPDIKQAKELSKIFNISLDELVDNQVRDVLVEKISNTERLAGIIINILKFVGIAFIVMLVINIIIFVIFNVTRTEVSSSGVEEATINCNLNNNDYLITVGSDAYFNCSNCSKDIQNDIKNLVDYSDIKGTIKDIELYFISNNGTCE